MSENPVRAFVGRSGDYRWDGVELLRYKEEGSVPFRDVTRQTLFRRPDMRGELRYFEVAPAGYSTLERHEHVHAVMILRGAGQVLVGQQVFQVSTFDLVTVPPLTWHQFRAGANSPLGFLCMVDAERDKPQLPSGRDLEEMRANLAVARFFSTKGD
ncbi:MAG: cupin domain-containing protein [Betaproteobacteria bacterium]|nr:MAG: cupin domain-containing protein [Betaproteobacteria bacterium]